jgi:hypothetical protein
MNILKKSLGTGGLRGILLKIVDRSFGFAGYLGDTFVILSSALTLIILNIVDLSFPIAATFSEKS